MAKILGNSLRLLQGLYSIVGGKVTTDEIDLGSVQLVQDVGRLVMSGRAPGLNGQNGRIQYVIANDHAAAVEVTQSIDIYQPANLVAPWPQIQDSDFDMWLVSCFCTIFGTAFANFKNGEMTIAYEDGQFIGAFVGGTGLGLRTVWVTNQRSLTLTDPSATYPAYTNAAQPEMIPRPGIFIPRGSGTSGLPSIRLSSEVSAVTASCDFFGVAEFIAVPKGTVPP